MTYALATGVERHIAAPRTALNTGNGTRAAPGFDWEGVGAPPTPMGVGTTPAGRPKNGWAYTRVNEVAFSGTAGPRHHPYRHGSTSARDPSQSKHPKSHEYHSESQVARTHFVRPRSHEQNSYDLNQEAKYAVSKENTEIT